MALDKERLKGKISEMMTDMLTRENTSIEEFASRMADAFVDEVKEAKINYVSGLIAPNGAVTGTFEGSLS